MENHIKMPLLGKVKLATPCLPSVSRESVLMYTMRRHFGSNAVGFFFGKTSFLLFLLKSSEVVRARIMFMARGK